MLRVTSHVTLTILTLLLLPRCRWQTPITVTTKSRLNNICKKRKKVSIAGLIYSYIEGGAGPNGGYGFPVTGLHHILAARCKLSCHLEPSRIYNNNLNLSGGVKSSCNFG